MRGINSSNQAYYFLIIILWVAPSYSFPSGLHKYGLLIPKGLNLNNPA